MNKAFHFNTPLYVDLFEVGRRDDFSDRLHEGVANNDRNVGSGVTFRLIGQHPGSLSARAHRV